MTENFVTLLCPAGAWDYPISHGRDSYYPYRLDLASQDAREYGGPWAVRVPSHTAPHFTATGGFVLMEDRNHREPDGWRRMRHPMKTGCSWRGHSYEPDERGHVLVPEAAVGELTSHGYVVVLPDEAHDKADEPTHVDEPKASATAPAKADVLRKVPDVADDKPEADKPVMRSYDAPAKPDEAAKHDAARKVPRDVHPPEVKVEPEDDGLRPPKK